MKRVYIEYKVEHAHFQTPELHTLEVEVPDDLPLALNHRWASRAVRDHLTRTDPKFSGRVYVVNIIGENSGVDADSAGVDPTVTQSDGRKLNLTLW